MTSFQIQLSGVWKDFGEEENRVLKQAFSCGYPKLWSTSRGQLYEYDFLSMRQTNTKTKKVRSIRPPYKAKGQKPSPSQHPVLVVEVPAGSIGSVIDVAHPIEDEKYISVFVPEDAQEGQKMMVRVFPEEHKNASTFSWNPLEDVWEAARNDVPAEPPVGKVRVGKASLQM